MEAARERDLNSTGLHSVSMLALAETQQGGFVCLFGWKDTSLCPSLHLLNTLKCVCDS